MCVIEDNPVLTMHAFLFCTYNSGMQDTRRSTINCADTHCIDLTFDLIADLHAKSAIYLRSKIGIANIRDISSISGTLGQA